MTEQALIQTSSRKHFVEPIDALREKSSLSGIFIEDSLAVNVLIFREHGESQWSLELHDDTSQPVIWRTTFATEQNAWEAFMHAVRIDGMESVAGSMKNHIR